MLARDISALHPGSTFVVDVKSTGLFMTDPVLAENGVKADYWKTGHSYIKRRVNELTAIAGFEKSGHYFFNAPIGRGYDDGLVSALAVLDMLDRNPGKSMADLRRALAENLGIADHVAALRRREEVQGGGERGAGLRGHEGAWREGRRPRGPRSDHRQRRRVVADDGTWGLVRASSNKPELVVVVESPVSEERMREMFKGVDCGAPAQSGSRRLQPDDLSMRGPRLDARPGRRPLHVATAFTALLLLVAPAHAQASKGPLSLLKPWIEKQIFGKDAAGSSSGNTTGSLPDTGSGAAGAPGAADSSTGDSPAEETSGEAAPDGQASGTQDTGSAPPLRGSAAPDDAAAGATAADGSASAAPDDGTATGDAQSTDAALATAENRDPSRFASRFSPEEASRGRWQSSGRSRDDLGKLLDRPRRNSCRFPPTTP